MTIIDRRQFITSAAVGVGGLLLSSHLLAEGPPSNQPVLAIVESRDIKAQTRKAVELLGGMKKFVPDGSKVIIKPNIGFDRAPELAATTHPLVVVALIELAKEAGAKEVLVMDNPCTDRKMAYKASGIAEAAEQAGAKVDFYSEDRCKKVPFPTGQVIKEWLVHPAYLEGAVHINAPIAKHHGLTGYSLGMKNHFGCVAGNRGEIHDHWAEKIVDLAAFFKPALTIIDGTRILLRNGPGGGNPKDVEWKYQVAATSDPVVADSYGVTLFDRKASEFSWIKLAASRGLGEMDLDKVKILREKV